MKTYFFLLCFTAIILLGLLGCDKDNVSVVKTEAPYIIKNREMSENKVLWLQEYNRVVLGPFGLVFHKDDAGYLEIRCRFLSEVAYDQRDMQLKDVTVSVGSEEIEFVSEMIEYSEFIGWRSKKPISWQEGMTVKGLLVSRVATEIYHVDNLHKNDKLTIDDMIISVHNESPAPASASASIYESFGLSAADRSQLWAVKAVIKDNLSQEDLSFLQKPEHQFHSVISMAIKNTDRYKKIKNDAAVAKLGSIERSGGKDFLSSSGVNRLDKSEWYFDSMQGGQDAFPIKIEVGKYKPHEFPFEHTLRKHFKGPLPIFYE